MHSLDVFDNLCSSYPGCFLQTRKVSIAQISKCLRDTVTQVVETGSGLGGKNADLRQSKMKYLRKTIIRKFFSFVMRIESQGLTCAKHTLYHWLHPEPQERV